MSISKPCPGSETAIRPVKLSDAAAVADIYNHYVDHTDISFETQPLTPDAMRSRIEALCADVRLRLDSGEPPYYVSLSHGIVTGYCYAHAWKERAAYNRTIETTVYVSPSSLHQGIGTALMQRLISHIMTLGTFHALIACITGGNTASCRMHEKLGFRRVSCFTNVGFKFGRYIDVTDYELELTQTTKLKLT